MWRPHKALEARLRGAWASSHRQWGAKEECEGGHPSTSHGCMAPAGPQSIMAFLQGSVPGPPPSMRTWEQLLAQGSASLPVAGRQLRGPVELLLQGQALGQDIGLSIGAGVQLESKQRERGCQHAQSAPATFTLGEKIDQERQWPWARPFTSHASVSSFVKRS